jgi:hypothetical protein
MTDEPKKSAPELAETICPKCGEKLDSNGSICWCENGHVFEWTLQ